MQATTCSCCSRMTLCTCHISTVPPTTPYTSPPQPAPTRILIHHHGRESVKRYHSGRRLVLAQTHEANWCPRQPIHTSIVPPPPPPQLTHPHLKVSARHTSLRTRGPTTNHSRRLPQYMKHCLTHVHTTVHLHPPFIYHPPHAPSSFPFSTQW